MPFVELRRRKHARCNAARRVAPLALCLLVAALVLPLGASSKKKSKQGVKIITLEKGDCRAGAAEQGDTLHVHYVGKLKDGTVFDDGTEKVGRPFEVVLGESQVVKGWHIGLEGICLGEKRRLVVPPKHGHGEEGKPPTIPGGATLIFDVEMVILNGQSALLAAVEEGEERMGVQEFCDSCHRVVEGFYEEWTRVMMEQRDGIQQRSGGSEPPSITYNDDTEAMVQGFCDSNAVASGDLNNSVAVGCREIFKGYKREIVGKFLTETVTWEMVPRKKDEICREMVGACGLRPTLTSPPPSECARCQATMDALRFDLRTQGELRRSKGLARQVWDTLDYICMRMHYRVSKAVKTQELCDDVVDDFGAAIVREAEAGTDWADISDLVCGEWGGYCSASEQLRRDEL